MGVHADDVENGLIYQDGAFSSMTYPGATTTDLLASNDRVDILGRALVGNANVYFVYNSGTFTPVDVPGLPSDINNQRRIVGTYGDANGSHG